MYIYDKTFYGRYAGERPVCTSCRLLVDFVTELYAIVVGSLPRHFKWTMGSRVRSQTVTKEHGDQQGRTSSSRNNGTNTGAGQRRCAFNEKATTHSERSLAHGADHGLACGASSLTRTPNAQSGQFECDQSWEDLGYRPDGVTLKSYQFRCKRNTLDDASSIALPWECCGKNEATIDYDAATVCSDCHDLLKDKRSLNESSEKRSVGKFNCPCNWAQFPDNIYYWAVTKCIYMYIYIYI